MPCHRAEPKRKKEDFFFSPGNSSANEKSLYSRLSIPSMDSLFIIALPTSFHLSKSSLSLAVPGLWGEGRPACGSPQLQTSKCEFLLISSKVIFAGD